MCRMDWAGRHRKLRAELEHRSVANMVEMLIRRYCDETGIVITAQSEMSPGKRQNG